MPSTEVAAGTLDQEQPWPDDGTGGGVHVAGPSVPVGLAPFSRAQTFTAGLSGALGQVDLHIAKETHFDTTAPLVVEIRNVDGGVPGPAVLASTTVPAADVSPRMSWVAVRFASPAIVTAGTQYAIVLYSEHLYTLTGIVDEGGAYAGGSLWFSPAWPPSGGWQHDDDSDIAFRTYVVVAPPADSTPPSISAPSSLTVDATSPQGAVVDYTVTAADDADRNPSVSCSPPSGSTFPIGTTTVNCTATDASGNTASASFPVTVKSPAQQVPDQVAVIQSYNLDKGTENSLTAKLDAALKALEAGDTATACNSLDSLINHASAQSGKKLTTAQASEIIDTATRIRNAIGC